MPEPFSIDNGLMTPTLKLRRHLIVKANQSLLDSLYSSRQVTAGPGPRTTTPPPGKGAALRQIPIRSGPALLPLLAAQREWASGTLSPYPTATIRRLTGQSSLPWNWRHYFLGSPHTALAINMWHMSTPHTQ